MKISIRIVNVLALLAASIFLTPGANGWSQGSSIAVSVFSGTSNEEVRGSKIDSHGNIFTTGLFFGTVDFDPSDEIFNLTALGNREIFVSKMDPFGNLLWAKGFGGTSDDSGNAISLDSSGNIYIAGNFSLSVDFDPGAGVANLVAEGLEDAFILKLDSSGNYLWAKSFGGSTGYDNATMALDSSGNAFVTGRFFGTVDFDPGIGTSNLISVGSNSDIFILKLDPSGNYLWAKSFGDVNADAGNSIAVDRNGYVYTTGQFRGTIDFDPGEGTVNIIAGSDDVFISKLDSLGNFVWAKSMGGSEGDYSNSIQVDIDGSVYTAGQFSGTADFDPGAVTASLLSKGPYDIFVSKLDSSGDYVWAKSMGGVVEDVAYSLTLDSSGNVYTTGRFKGTADFDPSLASSDLSTDGLYDVFISKLNSSGEYVWAKRIGGTTDDVGRSITTDSSGHVYTSGSFKGTVDFNPGTGISNFTSNGDGDIFISKLDSSGNAPSIALVITGPIADSKVATIPSGVTEAAIAATTALPAIKLNFGGLVPTTVTVKPITNPAPSSATPFSTSNSPKIVDIVLDGAFSGSVTLCLDGGSADRLYHYINSAWVELGSRNYVNGQVCGVTTSFSPFVAAPVAAPVYVAPTPVPYLKTLTSPKLNLKEGKLVCTPGIYNSGYTLDGVIQGSPTAIYSPSIYTYNLLINGVAQTSKVVTSASTSTSWELQAIPSGSLVACSVTVNANSLTNTDKSSDNTAAVSTALTTQSQAIKAAEAAYSETVSVNSKSYQKALVDNRATWRKEIETIQSNYSEALSRIKAKGGPKTSSETSAALKLRIAASKKSAADYAASKPAALAAKDAANKAALDAKSAAIAKANLNYGTLIESIGYGVLIP